jgi:hypothetical protein
MPAPSKSALDRAMVATVEQAAPASPIERSMMNTYQMTLEEVQSLKRDPDLIMEYAQDMGLTPFQLVRMLKSGGHDLEGEIKDQTALAAAAMREARAIRSKDLESQTRSERRAIAVTRLEACYRTLMTLGTAKGDGRTIRLAASVAMDIAKVDGTLGFDDSTEKKLEEAAAAIRAQRLNAPVTYEDGVIVKGAIIKKKELSNV